MCSGHHIYLIIHFTSTAPVSQGTGSPGLASVSEEESWTSAHCHRAPSMQREPGREEGNKVQANAAGQSRKIRRETWILKQGRCFLRCCSVQGTWR